MPRPEQICGTSQGDTRGARGRSASKMAGSVPIKARSGEHSPAQPRFRPLTRVEAG